jgi:ribonuclease III
LPDAFRTAVSAGLKAVAIAPWLAGILRREPRDPELFATALTHRSAHDRNNERLEFLGDAVLNMVMADALYQRFPLADEGNLSRLRSRLVSSPPLAQIGSEIGIGAVLRLGSGELKSGGFRRESILADAIEALIGASYLDAGLEAARELVLRLFADRLDALLPDAELKDPKTRLQEMLQGRGLNLPVYVLVSATGEPHAQTFRVRCEVGLEGRDAAIVADGEGTSRRGAEQQAAGAALLKMSARGISGS